jgi:nucleotide-binding universal stress UspA family protein
MLAPWLLCHLLDNPHQPDVAMAFKHILLPTDFSEGAGRATAVAVELAQKFDAKITLLHAYSLPAMPYAEGITFPIAEIEAAARDALGAALERLKERRPNTDAVLSFGVAWQQIIAAVTERDADMVVMGTHGRRGVARALLGSVAEKVVRLSPVPVLVVPPLREKD